MMSTRTFRRCGVPPVSPSGSIAVLSRRCSHGAHSLAPGTCWCATPLQGLISRFTTRRRSTRRSTRASRCGSCCRLHARSLVLTPAHDSPRSVRWRTLLVASWGFAALWACSLAATRGWFRVTTIFERKGEYLAVLPRVHSIGDFVDQFVHGIRSFPVHVQGHPPGFVLVAWTLERLGLGGSLPASVLCIAVGAAAVPAVLVTVREVAGADRARRAAPFLVLAPFAISVATSADAFFAGVGAWAVTLVVLATGRRDRRGDVCALLGGVLSGITVFLSYGLVLLAVIPIVVAIRRRRVRPLLLAGAGALPVVLAFLLAGFWWFDGLEATRARYFAGIASSARTRCTSSQTWRPSRSCSGLRSRRRCSACATDESGCSSVVRCSRSYARGPERHVEGRGGADLVAVRAVGRARRTAALSAGRARPSEARRLPRSLTWWVAGRAGFADRARGVVTGW